jgi:flagellar motor switch protein FliM
MTDEPSQDEINQLLPNIPPGEAAGGPFSTPADQLEIKIYDFKRPDKFSKDQIRTVAIMHETFARQATAALSSQLFSLAHVHVASVDQLTYEEFIRSIPNPDTIAIVNMDPLKGSAILEISPAVTFAIIDRLFGGQGEGAKLTRELTDIELSIMAGVVARILGNLREAWTPVIDLHPRLGRIETNPWFAQIVPPSEMIVLVTLVIKVGDVEGMMNFCFPYLTIEPIIPKLSAQYFFSSMKRGGPKPQMAPATVNLNIPVEIYLEGARLSLRDLGGLKRGSLLKIPGYQQGKAFLRMGGRTLFGLKARRGGRGKPAAYTVVSGISKENMPFLEPAEKKDTPSALEILDSGMRDALRELDSKIRESLADMKSSFGALRQKQDEMADQLAFGPQDREAAGDEPRAEHAGPFDFLRRADPALVLNFIQQEHPQLIALVLSYLEPLKASTILGGLPQELQPDVARRIGCMGRTSPEVLREVERVLDMRLSTISSEDYTAAGGVEGLVEILNMADRSTERFVVDSLEKKDAELAEQIKRRMFVFEDIVLLDKKDVEKVLKKADMDVLLRAMKAAPEEVVTFILGCVPGEDVEKLKLRLRDLGPVRLHEVERAQQKVVGLIREMEETGEIVVARSGGETEMVK